MDECNALGFAKCHSQVKTNYTTTNKPSSKSLSFAQQNIKGTLPWPQITTPRLGKVNDSSKHPISNTAEKPGSVFLQHKAVHTAHVYLMHRTADGLQWPHGRTHLPHIEDQGDGVVEVGVGAASVDPEVPEDRKEHRAGDQHTGHHEDIPQD